MSSSTLDANKSRAPYAQVDSATAERAADSERAELALMAGDMACVEWDIPEGVVHCGAHLEKVFGLPLGRSVHSIDAFLSVIHPDDVSRIDAAINRTITDDVDYQMEWRIILPDGQLRWVGGRGRITERDAQGNAIRMLGVNWDISEQKEQQQALKTMASEMEHRLKNTFATIGALTGMAARRCETPTEMMNLLRGQLFALGKAHSLSMPSGQGSSGGIVRVADLVRTALEPWQGQRPQLDLDTDASISAQKAASLAMMMYELTTNATKYGGLSDDSAHLQITLLHQNGGDLVMDWRETVPEYAQRLHPKTGLDGFGTVLLAQAARMLDAAFEQDMRPEGLRLTLTIPAVSLIVTSQDTAVETSPRNAKNGA
ncbi:PAS domain S-box-containing protein [Monaibacterium marinum]|uniref:histidine kinase n=1 Tax=Pontivivens marinum TaxID=1690039 RepID=A0A2C9CQQ2_9RHOB|nr:sensor histidine kinase [Monaibacterium marinum]SOH93582.1 PAS domain S-box-containing protein [Monaibacterium marinum]